LQDIVAELAELNTTLVAVTPQIAEKSMEMIEKHSLTFPMLSDPGLDYLAQWGISFQVPDDIKKFYGGFGIDLAATNGDDSWCLPIPARLVVSRDGIVRTADIDPNYTARPEPQKTLDDVRSLG
jgi:peroxiredoxin